MKPSEQDLLAALQRGLPLTPRPFAALADELGCDEEAVLACVSRCRAAGTVRRFGAVFDTRRLGYTSMLCAVRVPIGELDAAAAALTPLRGVTHCYVREPFDLEALAPRVSDFPNLWFTLSYPKDVFAAFADEVRARLQPHEVHFLPATRRYKVDVVFGAAARAREESVADGAPLTAADRVVIKALQGDTDVCSDYFAALASQIGMPEWDLLSKLEIWRRSGRLKRVGLLLAHREAGWTANGMCCWRVEGDTGDAGRALAACGEVTHCYERPLAATYPYNLFAMVHARAASDAVAQFRRLEAATGLSDGVMLVSTKEYKKTSMTFFVDG
ncbi:MAG: hypothetical protein MJ240_08785 [Kiritimatiellae bacterium]|nr:hypothetical protein [Kiritimatiellia bacterium]